jgi:hypothetical protein
MSTPRSNHEQAAETTVITPPEPLGQWLARGAQKWSSYSLPIVHLAGGVLAWSTLTHAVEYRLLLQLLWDRVLVLGQFRALWLSIPLVLAFVVLLAGVQVVRAIRRLVRRQVDTDGPLKVRVLVYVAVACIAFNVFVLSTPEAFSGPFRVRFPIVAEISAALAYGGYALWGSLLPRLRRATTARARRALDILCMNAVAILVLAELSLRVLSMFWASPLLVTESSPSQIRRDSERRQPGQLLFGFPMNAGGHNDTEFLPRASRTTETVVSIGDSFSYGVVPHAFHFTTVAEREGSGFEIYNMGYPGIGPSDYAHLLQNDALPLEPDLVLIQLFVGNDIGDGPSPAGPARWHDADSYLAAVVWYRLQILRRAERVDVTQGVAGAVVATAALVDSYPWLADPSVEPASISRDVFLQLELRNAHSVSTMVEGVYERFFEALMTMNIVAGDVPIAFVLVPDEFQVEDDLWNELVAMSDVPLDREGPQRVVTERLGDLGLHVLDLLPALRAVEPMEDGRRHVYHLQDTHFNARGNAVAGRELARFVDSLLALPPEALRPALPPPPPVRTLPTSVDFQDGMARMWMTGWYPAEEAGGRVLAWSGGPQSTLTLSLPTDQDIRLTMEMLPFEFQGSPPQTVTVVLNDRTIEELELGSGLQSYSVILPEEDLRASTPIRLEFRYAWSRTVSEVIPSSPDSREIAVAWYSIELAP